MTKDTAKTESTEVEPGEVNLNKYEDFLFELDDNFTQKSQSFLSTVLDNSIKFEMDFVDETESQLPCFSSINLDDIHTLVNSNKKNHGSAKYHSIKVPSDVMSSRSC